MKSRITQSLICLLALISCSTFAQGTVFTYQGRVTDNGTNFSGTGSFKFALVTSSNMNNQATATANLTGAFVTSCTVSDGGSGYVTPPSLTFYGGGGSGAAATASISGGEVTAITVSSAGLGYDSPPTVIIGVPPANYSYTTFWSNDGTSSAGSEPAAAVSVEVENGLFTVVLGDTTVPDMTPIDSSLFSQSNLQLRIWFDDGIHGSSALSPMQNLTPTPYAITAENLASVVQNNTIVPGEYQTIGGGSGNIVSNYFSTIGGGLLNSALGFDATVAGGDGNVASGNTASVGGGSSDYSTGDYSTVGGGNNNVSSASFATVGGGTHNLASGFAATVAGGDGNKSTNFYATVGGGLLNSANGQEATVPGGYLNNAAGNYSFAAGNRAQALNNGSFVWADGSGTGFSSTADNQFSVSAAGGVLLAADVQIGNNSVDYHRVALGTGNSESYLWGSYHYFNADFINLGCNFYADANGYSHVSNTGAGTSRISAGWSEIQLAVGGVNLGPSQVKLDANLSGVALYGTVTVNGSVVVTSDRNAKQDFVPVSPAQILARVTRLPVTEWSLKEDPTNRHLGPMAQDFYSLFNIGTDDKHITLTDEGGVALAAIQGLNQKVESGTQKTMAQIGELKTENARLKARLEKLEQFMNSKTAGFK